MKDSLDGAIGVGATLALVLTCAACSQNWDAFDPRLTGGSATGPGGSSSGGFGGAGAAGGAGALGGMGGTGATGAGGSTGGGGTGNTGGVLSDDGLLVRYYLDEAAQGTTPTAALDVAPAPLPLPIQYVGQMEYTEEAGHRGMHWPVAGEDGGPHVPISGTKLLGLSGSTTGTIEAVSRIEQVSNNGSRLVHIGFDSGWSFTIGASFELVEPSMTISAPEYFILEGVGATASFGAHFDYGFDPDQRFVVHFVFDSEQAEIEERIRFYLDGQRLDPNDLTDFPVLGETILLEGTESIGLGNRAIGGRAVRGTLFYGAYYSTALSEATIAEHVAVLLASDDAP